MSPSDAPAPQGTHAHVDTGPGVEDHDGGAHPPTRHHVGALVVVAVFCLFVSVPLAALATGRRAQPVENRVAAAKPAMGLTDWLDTGHGAAWNAYLTDHMPYRDTGIRLDATVDYRLFRDSPNPEVVVGKGDWLFIDESIVGGCGEDPAAVVSGMDLLGRMAAAAGVPIVIIIPPDKAALYPDRLTGHSVERFRCAKGFRDALDDELSTIAAGAATLSVWDDLERWVSGTVPSYLSDDPAWIDAPLVYDGDTHWTTVAALTGTYATAQALSDFTTGSGSGVRSSSGAVQGDVAVAAFRGASLDGEDRKVEDLRTLIGLPRTVTAPRADLEIPGALALRSVDLEEARGRQPGATTGTSPADQAGLADQAGQDGDGQLGALQAAGFDVGADPSKVFPIVDGQIKRVAPYGDAAAYLARWYRHGGEGLIEGRTVMLGDSFMEVASVNQARLFSDIVMSQWAKLANPWRLEAVVAQADQLVIEAAERRVYETLDPQSALVRLVVGGLVDRVESIDLLSDPETELDRMTRVDDGVEATADDPQLLTGLLPEPSSGARRFIVMQLESIDAAGAPQEDEAEVFYSVTPGEFDAEQHLLQPVPATASTVIFELTGLEATHLRIDPSGGAGARVASLRLLDLPPTTLQSAGKEGR